MTLITVWLQVRVLPGPPIFACSASYGTTGHPVSRARYRRSRLCAGSGRGGLPRCFWIISDYSIDTEAQSINLLWRKRRDATVRRGSKFLRNRSFHRLQQLPRFTLLALGDRVPGEQAVL